jgi:pimeloyl-ACP methyl ester carboxylesterase
LYWDWPQDPTLYSYTVKTLQAGRATLAFDRLGTGASSHPVGTELNMTSDAFVLHQIVAWAHQQGMTKVNSIAHSLGSAIATREAAEFHDVDHLVLTGILHFQSDEDPVGFPGFYPAQQDPAFSRLGLDSSYLTTIPGVRGQLFYNQQFADSTVIAFDEMHKDLVTTAEFATGLQEVGTPAPLNISAGITAPVLIILGQQDAFFCGGAVDCGDAAQVAAHEAPYFPRAANFTAITVANAGHDLTLHPAAPQSFASINQWLNK